MLLFLPMFLSVSCNDEEDDLSSFVVGRWLLVHKETYEKENGAIINQDIWDIESGEQYEFEMYFGEDGKGTEYYNGAEDDQYKWYLSGNTLTLYYRHDNGSYDDDAPSVFEVTKSNTSEMVFEYKKVRDYVDDYSGNSIHYEYIQWATLRRVE